MKGSKQNGSTEAGQLRNDESLLKLGCGSHIYHSNPEQGEHTITEVTVSGRRDHHESTINVMDSKHDLIFWQKQVFITKRQDTKFT